MFRQLLELGLLVVLLVCCFFEFNRVLVVADEHVEVMLRGSRKPGVNASSGVMRPSVQTSTTRLVVVGAVADTRGFHGVAHAGHRRENRVNGDDADGLAGLLVLVARAEAADRL
jgi:hypothetical protein